MEPHIGVVIALFVIAFTMALVGTALLIADSSPRDWTRCAVWLQAAAIPLVAALRHHAWRPVMDVLRLPGIQLS